MTTTGKRTTAKTSTAKTSTTKTPTPKSPTTIDNGRALALWTALDRSNAVAEFDLQGTVLSANANFLVLIGYSEADVIGQPYSLVLDPEETRSAKWKQLWASLAKGNSQGGEFLHRNKDGQEVWLQTSFSPVVNSNGKPESVIGLATDITASRNQSAIDASTIAAIERSMAVIEFAPDGTILRANPIMLQVMGYGDKEIIGQHHRLFVSKEEASSPAYKQFWASLSRGECQRGQFQRITKSGEPVWLEASYNPILDASGTLVRVVKFAYDITAQFNQAAALMGTKSAQLEAALEESREAERVRLELDRTLQEMSTPVTPIWDEILLLPLVGIVDSTRTDDVMRKTLDRISQTGSKMFILDISGVPTVDTAVANQLIKITKATRIMGCETLVSGVSSSIAHTIVELGVDISELRTTATLKDAFSTCLSEMGVLDLQRGRMPFRSQQPTLHRQRTYR